MFDTQLIIGHSEGKISDKYRIFLPAFSKIVQNDNIIFAKTTFEKEPALKIIAYKYYLEIIERLKNLRNNARSLEEYNKYSNEIENLCFLLAGVAIVDAQKRLALPKYVVEEYNWNVGDTICYDGLGESILVRKKINSHD